MANVLSPALWRGKEEKRNHVDSSLVTVCVHLASCRECRWLSRQGRARNRTRLFLQPPPPSESPNALRPQTCGRTGGREEGVHVSKFSLHPFHNLTFFLFSFFFQCCIFFSVYNRKPTLSLRFSVSTPTPPMVCACLCVCVASLTSGTVCAQCRQKKVVV